MIRLLDVLFSNLVLFFFQFHYYKSCHNGLSVYAIVDTARYFVAQCILMFFVCFAEYTAYNSSFCEIVGRCKGLTSNIGPFLTMLETISYTI